MTSVFRSLCSTALIAAVCGGCYRSPQNPFLGELKFRGFEQETPLVVYNSENVFDYINGEADIYLAHGFRLLYTLDLRGRNSGALMTVDAYDMSAPRGARAVFKRLSEDGGSIIAGVGDAAIAYGNTVLIQRGSYFVRIAPGLRPDEKIIPEPGDLLLLARELDAVLTRF